LVRHVVADVSDQLFSLDVVHALNVFVATVVIYVCNFVDAFADRIFIMIDILYFRFCSCWE
jgi:hypothetical protein